MKFDINLNLIFYHFKKCDNNHAHRQIEKKNKSCAIMHFSLTKKWREMPAKECATCGIYAAFCACINNNTINLALFTKKQLSNPIKKANIYAINQEKIIC